jgi:hypothetical protein
VEDLGEKYSAPVRVGGVGAAGNVAASSRRRNAVELNGGRERTLCEEPCRANHPWVEHEDVRGLQRINPQSMAPLTKFQMNGAEKN